MKNIFIILILLTSLNQVITQTECKTNLECIDTGCCYESKCNKASKCNKINKISYGLIAAAGVVLIFLNFLYFFYKVKTTRKVVLELKKIDDKIYSKRKSSNLEILKKLRERQNINI